jgi:carbon monoxide dehydrogenase subunit G
MDMTGEYRIAAPRDAVWRALNDPEVLKQSISGCEELVKVSDTELTAKVHAKVGPVSARFAGKVTLSDIDPPNGYTIAGEGQGGVAGFAKGGAKVRLVDDGGQTLLRYEANAQVGGKLAQIGSRLIDSTARKYADDFFGKFAAAVAGAQSAPAAAPSSAPSPTAVPDAEIPVSPQPPAATGVPAAGPTGGLSPAIWIGGLVALVVIVLIAVLA